MNMLGDDYIPAFPCTITKRVFTEEAMKESGLPDALAYASGTHAGMSLRDYFAAQALAMCGVMLSARDMPPAPADVTARSFAGLAYEIADAMLKERAK